MDLPQQQKDTGHSSCGGDEVEVGYRILVPNQCFSLSHLIVLWTNLFKGAVMQEEGLTGNNDKKRRE